MKRTQIGPWEDDLGFTQAIEVNGIIYISGTTADLSLGTDFETQIKSTYKNIQNTLDKIGKKSTDIFKEVIYTLDIESLKNFIDFRKSFYNGIYPTATWVEVKRLFSPEILIEIQIELRA